MEGNLKKYVHTKRLQRVHGKVELKPRLPWRTDLAIHAAPLTVRNCVGDVAVVLTAVPSEAHFHTPTAGS